MLESIIIRNNYSSTLYHADGQYKIALHYFVRLHLYIIDNKLRVKINKTPFLRLSYPVGVKEGHKDTTDGPVN